MRSLIAASLLVAVVSPASAQSVMGTWLTQSKAAEVKLEPCADAARGPICGTVMKLINPKSADGQPMAPETVTDLHNTDPALRGRKVLGMMMLYDFKKTSDASAFEEGTIYNGENGKTYRANISLQADGTLRLRGYVGTPLFGETQIWTRVQ